MSNSEKKFIHNPHIKKNEEKYLSVELNMHNVIQSWRQSLFSFEWLLSDGRLRSPEEMTTDIKEKYEAALTLYKNNEPLPMPILGIGVLDNIEIGSGKEYVLMMYGQNVKSFSAHIAKNDEKEFTSFLQKG